MPAKVRSIWSAYTLGCPRFLKCCPVKNSVTHALEVIQSCPRAACIPGNLQYLARLECCMFCFSKREGHTKDWLDRFSSLPVTLIQFFTAHTVLPYLRTLFGRIATEMILWQFWWRSHLQVMATDLYSVFLGVSESKEHLDLISWIFSGQDYDTHRCEMISHIATMRDDISVLITHWSITCTYGQFSMERAMFHAVAGQQGWN